jgi:predicted pyridoxine 5'-phosphate oxidase superfamily flavin-nucleotide-binding protein
MAKKMFDQIESEHRSFIERQNIFFVATAAGEGRVNVAPKGMDTLRIADHA